MPIQTSVPITSEESKRLRNYVIQMNLLSHLISSNNYKRMIRLSKIVVKRNGAQYKEIEGLVAEFEKRFMAISKAQNFLMTGLLYYDIEGDVFTRDELEDALESLMEKAVDIANEYLEGQIGSSVESGDVL
jgi:hypothetical protein